MNHDSRQPIYVLVGGIALLVAAVAGGFAAPNAAERIATSSHYCSRCHQPAAEQVRGHGDLECVECHRIREEVHYALAWGALVRSDSEQPEHGEIGPDYCEDCHRDRSDYRLLMLTDGHEQHVSAPAEVECVSCHAEEVHGDEGAATCESCHEDLPEVDEPTAQTSCEVCHGFRMDAPGLEDAPVVLTGTVSEGLVGAERMHGNAGCRRCHNPHDVDATATIEALDCNTCHRASLEVSVATGPSGHRDCIQCHTNVHADREQVAAHCTRCHAAADPASGWTVSEDAAGVAVVDPESLPHEGRCQNCHQPHTWTPSEAVCIDCHEDQVEGVESMPEESHEGCLGCHNPHEFKPTAQICSDCHRNITGARGTPPPHRDCVGCHEPHEPRPRAAVVCARCHTETASVLRGGPRQHANCASCHRPHGNPVARASSACGRCHSDQSGVLTGAGVPTQHRNCASCHQPHRFAPRAADARCSSCHSLVTARNASHSGPCTTCHTPHAAPVGRAASCAGCHEDVRPTVSGHNQCNGCHAPHQPAGRARANCRDCHRTQVAASSTWPRTTPHHSRCNECHTAHNESNVAQCGQCHEDKGREHAGAHNRCEQCHAPHRPRPPEGWWGQCGSCHRDQARRARGAVGDHASCENCHSPPGASFPSCTSCHQTITRVAMHRVAEHQDCKTCHDTHGTAAPVRARCLACHTDRGSHFADAPRCQSCHPFRP